MSHRTVVKVAALTLIASSLSTDASALALLGGTIGLGMVPGSGACNASAQVSTSTAQDVFLLNAATPSLPICAGQSATGSMHAEAATRSVGLKLTASGPQTTAAAQVSFVDSWTITPPPGTPAGFITMPVSFTLEGLVAAGSTFSFGRYLDYVFSISDPNSGAGNPLQTFQVTGQVTATGLSALTFNGSVSFRNFNQATLPMKAAVEMSLLVPQLNAGSIDFYNTAVASIALPPGFSATTSSGVPLVFAPVPEPGAAALWALGLLAVGMAASRRLD